MSHLKNVKTGVIFLSTLALQKDKDRLHLVDCDEKGHRLLEDVPSPVVEEEIPPLVVEEIADEITLIESDAPETVDVPAEAPLDPNKMIVVMEAIERMVNGDTHNVGPDDRRFNGDGAPWTETLAKESGVDLTASQSSEAWAEYTKATGS